MGTQNIDFHCVSPEVRRSLQGVSQLQSKTKHCPGIQGAGALELDSVRRNCSERRPCTPPPPPSNLGANAQFPNSFWHRVYQTDGDFLFFLACRLIKAEGRTCSPRSTAPHRLLFLPWDRGKWSPANTPLTRATCQLPGFEPRLEHRGHKPGTAYL